MLILKSVFFFSRIIWTSLVTASLSAFIYYSFDIYRGWCEEPIVMNFDDKLADIYDIPFPAVSTCNAQKLFQYLIFNFQVTICLNAKFSKLFVDLKSHLKKYQSGEIDEER
jgi:hypothetical protein